MTLVKVGTGIVSLQVGRIHEVAVCLVRRIIEGMAVGIRHVKCNRVACLAEGELQWVVSGVGLRLNALERPQTLIRTKRVGVVSASNAQIDGGLTHYWVAVHYEVRSRITDVSSDRLAQLKRILCSWQRTQLVQLVLQGQVRALASYV